jgi:hypothetical protein
MAGYSGTPLVKKLGIKSGDRVVLMNAPPGFKDELEDLPQGVRFARERSKAEVALVFSKSLLDLEKKFKTAAQSMTTAGMIWVAWPKKASGIETDLVESKVRGFGLSLGLVDIKVCAINDTWSGLKFVIPVKDRGKHL